MIGMLQILTYLLAFYLVVKGFEFIQRAMVAPEQYRRGAGMLATVVFIGCVVVAIASVVSQDDLAMRLSSSNPFNAF